MRKWQTGVLYGSMGGYSMNDPNDRWSIGFSLIAWFVFTLFGVIWTISSIYMYKDFNFGSFNIGFIYLAIGVGATILGIVRIVQILMKVYGIKRSDKARKNEVWIKDETQDQ